MIEPSFEDLLSSSWFYGATVFLLSSTLALVRRKVEFAKPTKFTWSCLANPLRKLSNEKLSRSGPHFLNFD